MKTVGLRKDTVTQLSADKREALLAAPLVDVVFGEDLTLLLMFSQPQR
jgi:hypothetical protein